MIDGLKPLGVATDYADLHRIFRERADALQIGRLNIDEIAGLPAGYTSKLLQPIPAKGMGPMALGALLGALGLVLVVADCPKRRGKVLGRYMIRNEKAVHQKPLATEAVIAKFLQKRMAELGRLGGIMRAEKASSSGQPHFARSRWRHKRKLTPRQADAPGS